MGCTFTCPNCGEKHPCGSEERKPDRSAGIPVARRSTGFSGGITSLHELSGHGFVVELPCGCEIYTVN